MTDLDDISKLCGVSITTVSKALNGKPGVKEETRQRVLRIAETFKYRPNQLIRSLQTGRSMTVGITCNHMCDEFMGGVVDGMLSVLYQAQYDALIINWDASVQDGGRALRTMAERRADGILMCPPSCSPTADYLEELRTFHRPIVVVDQTLPTTEYDFVGSQDFEGAILATEHLISLGHKRIANLFFKSTSTGLLRYEGYRHAMMQHGLPVHHKWNYELVSPSLEEAYRSAANLFAADEGERPTAVVAFNDTTAAQVVAAAFDKGLNVPRDVSVVGFADLSIASLLRPALTTVAQNPLEIGRRAAGMLLKHIQAGEKSPTEQPKIERLPVNLIVRQSTTNPSPANS